MNSSDNSY